MHLAKEPSSLLTGHSGDLVAKTCSPELTSAADGEPENTQQALSELSISSSDATKTLASMLESYSSDIDGIGRPARSPTTQTTNDSQIVLLTGSTGAIGTYVLNVLLTNANIDHIYCLNRTADARDRQMKINLAKDLDASLPPNRVTFLHGDLSDGKLGLSSDMYDSLLERITYIIHNAWTVNFNKPFASFAPSIEGIIELVRFAIASRQGAHIQFLSSLTSVFNYSGTTVPEEVFCDHSTPLTAGSLGINASIVRLGQVAGAARTASGWNKHEWFPSLITTCAFLGVLPESLVGVDKVDWIPIDQVASILVELMFVPDTNTINANGANVYHIVHPRPSSWKSMLPLIKRVIEDSGLSNGLVTVLQWDEFTEYLVTTMLAKVESKVDGATLRREIPSSRLIEFCMSLAGAATKGLSLTLTTQNTRALSTMLANLEPLQDACLEGWVKEWLDAATP